MKWSIPAKTFLIGEYVALQGGPAIVLTTNPCFEFTLTNDAVSMPVFHPQSPAGHWLCHHSLNLTPYTWFDPYQGCGGLGASSAQIIGAYLATKFIEEQPPSLSELLEFYHDFSRLEEGVKPSGYDLLAQLKQGCVYIHKENNAYEAFSWPFPELDFLIIHTQRKLTTHEHLKTLSIVFEFDTLKKMAYQAMDACQKQDADLIIHSINCYYQALLGCGLVAPHSQAAIQQLSLDPNILAIKGCGALGADTLLLIIDKAYKSRLQERLAAEKWLMLASANSIYNGQSLI